MDAVFTWEVRRRVGGEVRRRVGREVRRRVGREVWLRCAALSKYTFFGHTVFTGEVRHKVVAADFFLLL